MDEKRGPVNGEILMKSSSEVEWRIADFFLLPEFSVYFSPYFSYLDETWSFICLICSPIGISANGITFYLHREHSTSRRNITLRLGVKMRDGPEYMSSLERLDFKVTEHRLKFFLPVDIPFLRIRKYLFAYGDEISFFCTFLSGHSEDAASRTIGPHGVDKLSENFEELFLSGDHHDIIIKVQDQEIRAHKLIIVVRCPVFAAMFRHNTIEKNTRVITIDDCDPEAFREFLYFLYSGKLENVSAANVIELYVIADKYQVHEVKSECLEFMMRNMSDETFCDFISLALRHNERDLLNVATNYFVKNVKTIIVTVKWQSFHKEYPVESNELHIKAISHLIPD